MSRWVCNKSIPRRAPPPAAPLCLSELRAVCAEQGLRIDAGSTIAVLDGPRVLHEAATLHGVRVWLDER